MAALRDLALQVGVENPKTILQSGNLVFECSGKAAELEASLEAIVQANLGMQIPFCVRSEAEIGLVVSRNPFLKEAIEDPGQLLVTFLKSHVDIHVEAELKEKWAGPEAFCLATTHLYTYYPQGVGTSKLPARLVEKCVGVGTARNWNTLLKIDALFKQSV